MTEQNLSAEMEEIVSCIQITAKGRTKLWTFATVLFHYSSRWNQGIVRFWLDTYLIGDLRSRNAIEAEALRMGWKWKVLFFHLEPITLAGCRSWVWDSNTSIKECQPASCFSFEISSSISNGFRRSLVVVIVLSSGLATAWWSAYYRVNLVHHIPLWAYLVKLTRLDHRMQ